MADYVSKYTGSEVDGILDEAIELPQSSYADEGKILTVNSTGEPVWADKINIDTSLKDIEGFSTNKYLRAVGGTAVPEWTDWDIPDYSGVGQGSILTVESCWNGENKLVWNDTYTTANDGQYLKYSSNTGIVWDNPIDISSASDGDVLKYSSSTGPIWGSLSGELPVHHNSNYNNSILIIDNYGDVNWCQPQVEGSDGDFLRYSENRGIIWDNPLDTSEASEGQFLKYTGDTHDLEWGDPIDTSGASDGDVLKYDQYNGIIWDTPIDTDGASEGEFLKYGFNGLEWDKPIDTSNANNGEVLKYSSNTGIMWGNPLDTSGADDGEVLKYSSNTGIMWGSVSGTLPEYNGDGTVLLTMASGNPDWLTVEDLNILPMYVADSYEGNDCDKVLTVDYNAEDGLSWRYPEDMVLPSYDHEYNSSDSGKVLTVLNNGHLGWVSPNQ